MGKCSGALVAKFWRADSQNHVMTPTLLRSHLLGNFAFLLVCTTGSKIGYDVRFRRETGRCGSRDPVGKFEMKRACLNR